ncbi:MAG TPA: nuclear transport factor 2 family protein [Leptolyngbyaceae cyanobacterium M65_K2018_010]|nr:nuclear transport factor 2 family protein [Leptolyngbyaceae cyanobacterium M65_K2018_010]
MGRYFLGPVSVVLLGLSPWGNGAAAATATTAPPELLQTLERIEAAANDRDLDAIMQFYSQTFSSDTGFDHTLLRQTLEAFWQRYGTLSYDIELLSWEPTSSGGYTIETLTRVQGVQVRPERRLSLSAEVTSRQRLQDGQVASQEILSETSRLVSGSNPPTVDIQLPNTLTPGQSFTFDTVVIEPLQGRSLMGVAVDEGVTAVDFFEPRPVVFDVLTAGGLYKLGTAPNTPDQRWISAVIIREDGLVVETRRVRVEPSP